MTPPSTGVSVRPAGPRDAAEVHTVVRAAFADRPRLDPPADALAETETSLAAALGARGGLLAELDGRPVGSLLLDPRGESLYLRRFGVVPAAQGRGVAGALVAAAVAVGTADDRVAELAVLAREELPASVAFWEAHGFRTVAREAPYLRLVRATRPRYDVPDAEAMRALGRELAPVLRAGDLLVLTGELGAGKTTFTQGLAAGLGVRGEVTSPTFVIARVHPALDSGPALVHADAYRLGGVAELDDLDLDATLEDAVTVVEWGAGLADGLAEDRLEVRITRASAEAAVGDLDPRRLQLVPVGARWARTAWPPTGRPPTGRPPTGIVSHETLALSTRGDAFGG